MRGFRFGVFLCAGWLAGTALAANRVSLLSSKMLNWSEGTRCATTILEHTGGLLLPPQTTLYFAGLAITTHNSQKALGLRDVIGSHKEMEPFIPFALGRYLRDLGTVWATDNVIYGGELAFSNPLPYRYWGKLVAINHTSSFAIQELRKQNVPNDRGGWLVERLKETHPLLVSTDMVAVNQYHSDYEHLVREMPGNMRHDFYSNAMEFAKLAGEQTRWPSLLGEHKEHPMSVDDFLLRFQWLARYLDAHPLRTAGGYAEVIPLIEKWRNGTLSDKGPQSLAELIEKIIWAANAISDPILVLPL